MALRKNYHVPLKVNDNIPINFAINYNLTTRSKMTIYTIPLEKIAYKCTCYFNFLRRLNKEVFRKVGLSLVILCLANTMATSQQVKSKRMKNTVSTIETPLSLQAKFIANTMALLQMDKKLERKILNNSLSKEAAKIPKSFYKSYAIQTVQQDNRSVWEIERRSTEPQLIILYLHGGAYCANLTTPHWQLIEKLVLATNAKVIVPDYPLAPEANCLTTYQFIDTLYKRLSKLYPDKQIVFMGDSAGGGIALGFAQTIKNEAIKQPSDIVLFSPWLDASMSHPDLLEVDKKDHMLSVNGLKYAGINYAGGLALTDYRVSPIYGDFNGLARITIFTGTNDILVVDARKCKKLLEEQGVDFNYFEYKDLFHDWVIITSLIESRDVINKVSAILRN